MRLDRTQIPDARDVGTEMYELMRELYPIGRSLTGPGVVETFERLKRHADLRVVEVPSGTQIFDWVVPLEWTIREAWIKDASGAKIVDFDESNLHVLGYSVPMDATVPADELRAHLYTDPEHPDWIPWRTSYWAPNWGFSLTHETLGRLNEPEYRVLINSSLEEGALRYAEASVAGEREDEVLLTTYVCHPSLCNDGISGIVLITMLAKYLAPLSTRLSYRFLLSPGTVGPLTWLAQNQSGLGSIKHGLVASCVGDPGSLTYKRSRRGNAEVDRAAAHVLRHSGDPYAIEDFTPWGGDERQFCSPGFDLPVGSLMRTPPGRFAEYHTSADNLDFVSPASLADSFAKYLDILEVLEGNETYVSQNPYGEPQLGRRGLYRAISAGAPREDEVTERSILWVLNLSEGDHSLLDIAERADLPFSTVRDAADLLLEHDLLAEAAA
jgi:aminopeptidase-like protein